MKIFQQFFFSLALGGLISLLFTPLGYADSSCKYTPHTYQLIGNPTTAITSDRNGIVWVSSHEDGVGIITRIDQKNTRDPVTYYMGTSYNFSDNFVTTADMQGNLWILSIDNQMLTKLHVGKETSSQTYDVLQRMAKSTGSSISAIAADTNNLILGAGLQPKIKGTAILRLPVNNVNGISISSGGLNNNMRVIKIVPDQKNHFWIIYDDAKTISLVFDSLSGYPPITATAINSFSGALYNHKLYLTNTSKNSVTQSQLVTDRIETNSLTRSTDGELDSPGSITVDPQGNIWIVNKEKIVELPVDDKNPPITYPFQEYGLPSYVDIIEADSNGNIWAVNKLSNYVTVLIRPSNCKD